MVIQKYIYSSGSSSTKLWNCHDHYNVSTHDISWQWYNSEIWYLDLQLYGIGHSKCWSWSDKIKIGRNHKSKKFIIDIVQNLGKGHCIGRKIVSLLTAMKDISLSHFFNIILEILFISVQVAFRGPRSFYNAYIFAWNLISICLKLRLLKKVDHWT